MADLPPTSVIICSYTLERWSSLVEAVESVRKQRYAAAEILVVADHNPDLFNRLHRELPDVVPLENRGPRGPSSGRNTGIAAACGEIIAFLDDDISAAPDWLERLVSVYADPAVVGVGGFIEPAWTAPPPVWFPAEFRWVLGCSYRGLPDRRSRVRNLIGANMSFRRSVFAGVGGFRSGLGHLGTRPGGDEETELCIRIHQRWPDAVILYDPAALVRHRVPRERASWRYFTARCYAEGKAKAHVSRMVGRGDGLAAERTYALRTLPTGMLGGIADAMLHGEVTGLARAGAIAAGLGVTIGGYVTETARVALQPDYKPRAVPNL